jgi:hypothetical protein
LAPREDELLRREALLMKVVADYDRRMATRWGRFLMWLLRKTT